MTAATFDRDTIYVGGPEKVLPPLALASGVTIYNGTLVAKDKTGVARPAADAAGYIVYGIASHQAIQADGDEITVCRGYAKFANSGSDALAAADVGHRCYVEDDQTVRKTPGTFGRRAGIFLGLDADDDQAIIYVGDPQPQSDAVTPVGSPVTSGAINPDKGHTFTSTTGTTALSLADGSFPGQRVTVTEITAASTPVGVITPATPIGFATVTVNTLGDTCTFLWEGTGWLIESNGGCTVA